MTLLQETTSWRGLRGLRWIGMLFGSPPRCIITSRGVVLAVRSRQRRELDWEMVNL